MGLYPSKSKMQQIIIYCNWCLQCNYGSSLALTRIELIQVIVSLDTEYMTVFPSLRLKMLLQEAAEKKRVTAMATKVKLALMADELLGVD